MGMREDLHLVVRGKIPSTINSKPEYMLMVKEMDETLTHNQRMLVRFMAHKAGTPTGGSK